MSFAWTIVALVAVLAICWRFLGSYLVAVFEGRDPMALLCGASAGRLTVFFAGPRRPDGDRLRRLVVVGVGQADRAAGDVHPVSDPYENGVRHDDATSQDL